MLRTDGSPLPALVETAAPSLVMSPATTALTDPAATTATTVTPGLTVDHVGVRHHRSRHDVDQQQVTFHTTDPKPTDPAPPPADPTPEFRPNLDDIAWDTGGNDVAAIIQAGDDAKTKAVFDVVEANIAAQHKHFIEDNLRHAKQDPIDRANAAAQTQQRQRQAQTQADVSRKIGDQEAAQRQA